MRGEIGCENKENVHFFQIVDKLNWFVDSLSGTTFCSVIFNLFSISKIDCWKNSLKMI